MSARQSWLLKKAPKTERRPFTLLEVFICMFILTLIGGLCALPVNNFLQRHRLISDAQTLQQQLEKLHQLSLVYNMEITADLSQSKEGLSCHFYTDETFPFPFPSNVNLKNIKGLAIDQKTTFQQKIVFYPDGRSEPSGVLSLYQDAQNSFSQLIEIQKLRIIKSFPNKRNKSAPANPN